jgi:hypothetical protein
MILKKFYDKKKFYIKIILLLSSFLIFGAIYYFLCDDYEFGGINILQEEIRKSSLKKFINTLEKGYLDDNIKEEINEKINKGEIDKNLNKKINKETEITSINNDITNKNRIQKFFDRVYFSIVTGTTLGYGDIYPLSNRVKIIVVLQLLTTIIILFH